MEISEIRGEFIKLNQWLKRENMVPTGGEAKFVIEAGAVKVNGKIATELRKKLYDGDIVEVDGEGSFKIQVVS